MITTEQFRFFADLVKTSSGIALAPGKEYLIESRLNELARVLGLRDFDALYQKARSSLPATLREQIVDAMTTNETYFFRDQHPFDALRNSVLPEIVKRNGTGRIRIWSAACSTGQEPYSMAMLLEDSFKGLTAGGKVEIIATDISRQSLEKGMAGRFTQVEVNRGLPVTLLIKHFKQNGAFWQANDGLRKMITFRSFNLLDPLHSLGSFDVIFCRYVLIYFEPETKRMILEKIAKALNHGGWLFLGATETPTGLPPSLEKISMGKGVCWQKKAG